jgi:hypothetical protein
MGRYGSVYSQEGIDWRKANDYQKVMDSRWKFLDINIEKYVDVSFDLTGQSTGMKKLLIYNNPLPYTAAFEVQLSTMSISSSSLSAPGFIAQDLYSYPDGIYYSFFWTSGVNTNIVRIKGMLRVYEINLLETYKAPYVPLTTAKPSPNGRYGAKYLDLSRGGNIDSTDPRKFTLYTPAKQISVHQSGIFQAVSGALTINHDVGYPPSYMLCEAYDSASPLITVPKDQIIYGPLFESFARAKATADTIIFQGVQSSLGDRKYGCIILKDPTELLG